MSNEADILAEFIRSETGYTGALPENEDLLKAGVLDSFNIVSLAMFAQERFNVEFDGDELVRDNLAQLSSLVALIRRKQALADTGAMPGEA